jgi:uncharacterized membrane protein HdeD (DUF308 family)
VAVSHCTKWLRTYHEDMHSGTTRPPSLWHTSMLWINMALICGLFCLQCLAVNKHICSSWVGSCQLQRGVTDPKQTVNCLWVCSSFSHAQWEALSCSMFLLGYFWFHEAELQQSTNIDGNRGTAPQQKGIEQCSLNWVLQVWQAEN